MPKYTNGATKRRVLDGKSMEPGESIQLIEFIHPLPDGVTMASLVAEDMMFAPILISDQDGGDTGDSVSYAIPENVPKNMTSVQTTAPVKGIRLTVHCTAGSVAVKFHSADVSFTIPYRVISAGKEWTITTPRDMRVVENIVLEAVVDGTTWDINIEAA